MLTRRVFILCNLLSAALLGSVSDALLAAESGDNLGSTFQPLPLRRQLPRLRHFTLSPPYWVALRPAQFDPDGLVHSAIEIIDRESSDGYPQAIDLLSRAIDRYPNEPTAYFNRAVCRDITVDKRGAIADYTRFLTLCPEDAEAYCLRAVTARRPIELALADFERAIQLDNSYGFAFYARGIRRMDDACDAGGAVEDFSRALDRPAVGYDYFSVFLNRAVARFDIADFAGAVADCTEAAIRVQSVARSEFDAQFLRSMALTNRGLIYATSGNAKAAVVDLNAYLDEKPQLQDTHICIYRAYARIEVGDWIGARSDLELVRQVATEDIRSHSLFPQGYLLRSDALAGLGDRAGALADLQKAADLLSGFKNEVYRETLERIQELAE